jgi:branched-chain amino acid transport system substrate-binding protein
MRRGPFVAGAACALACTAPSDAQILQFPTPLGQQTTGPVVSYGVAVPLSGPQKAFGQQVLNGAQGAAYDANQSKAPTDPLFNVRFYDDQGSMGAASSQASFIISDPTVVAVIGHLGGRITDLVVPRYGGSLVPQIVPASTYDPITTHGYRTLFRLPTKDSSEGQLHAQFVYLHKRPQKIVVFATDDDYGPEVAQAFIAQANADRVPVIRINVSASKPDYRGASTQGLAERPDFAFFAGSLKDLGGVLDLMRSGGYAGAMGASQGFFDPDAIARYGSAVDGLLVSSSMPPLNLAPTAFVAKSTFEQQYGPMTPLSAFGYAAAQIIIMLVRQTGANNRLTLARALNTPTPLNTVVGPFSFAPSGDPALPEIYFYTVKDGQWTYVDAARPTAFLLK